MAIAELPSLKPGAQVKVLFTLPGELLPFKIESEVCCMMRRPRAGLRSLMIPSEQKSLLQQWLAAKLEERLAGIRGATVPEGIDIRGWFDFASPSKARLVQGFHPVLPAFIGPPRAPGLRLCLALPWALVLRDR